MGAQAEVMGAQAEYTTKEVASHRSREDCWMTIRGEVYDVTKYLSDHPGGVDIMLEVAGKDATEEFDNAGHSEDADEIMAKYRVGTLKGASTSSSAPKAVRLAVKTVAQPQKALTGSSSTSSPSPAVVGGAAVVSVGALTAAALGLRRVDLARLAHLLPAAARHMASTAATASSSSGTSIARGGGLGFAEGFVAASAIALVAGGLVARRLSRVLSIEGHVLREAPHRRVARVAQADLLLSRGFLDPQAYQTLPLARKTQVAPGVYRLVFELPARDAVLGLPIGQHVAIKATIDGAVVQRSYTPVSNNADRGELELLVKVYADGLLTGRYLAGLAVGDEVAFRGPKGAMRYRRGLCRELGMLAGGTGITPMYQLIRAICEDPRDTTAVSLVYANRSEPDILLRAELDALARRYPRNLRVYYLLDHPPPGWTHGTGYVTRELMAERLPDPRAEGSKVMLCGPPGMVNAAKKALVELGYEKPGLSSKMTDQVFCF